MEFIASGMSSMVSRIYMPFTFFPARMVVPSALQIIPWPLLNVVVSPALSKVLIEIKLVFRAGVWSTGIHNCTFLAIDLVPLNNISFSNYFKPTIYCFSRISHSWSNQGVLDKHLPWDKHCIACPWIHKGRYCYISFLIKFFLPIPLPTFTFTSYWLFFHMLHVLHLYLFPVSSIFLLFLIFTCAPNYPSTCFTFLSMCFDSVHNLFQVTMILYIFMIYPCYIPDLSWCSI